MKSTLSNNAISLIFQVMSAVHKNCLFFSKISMKQATISRERMAQSHCRWNKFRDELFSFSSQVQVCCFYVKLTNLHPVSGGNRIRDQEQQESRYLWIIQKILRSSAAAFLQNKFDSEKIERRKAQELTACSVDSRFISSKHSFQSRVSVPCFVTISRHQIRDEDSSVLRRNSILEPES